jgi:hypothetical protein
MHNQDTRTLEKLFSHPLNMNLEWNEVKHMLEKMGASVDTTSQGHVKITLGSDVKTFKTFQKMLGDKHEIIELQHMLKNAGLAPAV